MSEDKRIVEINGVKIEIDMSTVKVISEFRIGDNVKILRNNQVFAGVIVEFLNFKELPTVVVAIFKDDYWGAMIEFLTFNAKTEGIEMVPCLQHELKLSKDRVIDQINKKITKAQNEVDSLMDTKEYFIKNFKQHFTEV
jgi:hypothetical protein